MLAPAVNSRLIASPNPVPPNLMAGVDIGLLKCLEIRAVFPAGTHARVADFEGNYETAPLRTGCPALQPSETLDTARCTVPCSVNLKAFESRFLSTC